MSWVEVDGAGWRWVHGLCILNEYFYLDFVFLVNPETSKFVMSS